VGARRLVDLALSHLAVVAVDGGGVWAAPATAGPLYRLVSEEGQNLASHWHRWVFYWVILALVAIHILANLWYGLAKKEPLITAMITGKKPAAPYLDAPEAVLVARPLLRALLCLIVSAALVFGTIFALGGKML